MVQLEFVQSPAIELSSVARAQLNAIRESLESLDGPGADAAIHELRKRTKRLRALLVLTESGVGKAQTRVLRRRLSALARDFSGAREQTVRERALATVLHQLEPAIPESEQFELFGLIATPPAAEVAPSASSPLSRRELALAEAAELLALLGPELFASMDPRKLFRGWLNSYRSARRSLKRVSPGDAVALHEARKHVKAHYYITQLVTGWCPALLKGEATLLDEVCELLGTHHDFWELRETLLTRSPSLPAAQAVCWEATTRLERLELLLAQTAGRYFSETTSARKRRTQCFATLELPAARAADFWHSPAPSVAPSEPPTLAAKSRRTKPPKAD